MPAPLSEREKRDGAHAFGKEGHGLDRERAGCSTHRCRWEGSSWRDSTAKRSRAAHGREGPPPRTQVASPARCRSAVTVSPTYLLPPRAQQKSTYVRTAPWPLADACALPRSSLRRLPASSHSSAGLLAHLNLASALSWILRLLSHSAMPLRSAPAVFAGQRPAPSGGAAAPCFFTLPCSSCKG